MDDERHKRRMGATETTTCPSLECKDPTIQPHYLGSMNFKCSCCEALHFEAEQTQLLEETSADTPTAVVRGKWLCP